jgi:hypothetical protein
MKALSVRQPWCWAIVHAGKRVENRDWLNAPTYRGPILIHAAKGCTRDEWADAAAAILRVPEFPFDLDVPPLVDLPRGGIVGRARLERIVRTGRAEHRWTLGSDGATVARGCELCGVSLELAHGLCPQADPWAVPGALGLILADVEPLPFVPLKGMLGLFNVDDAAFAAALAKARAA